MSQRFFRGDVATYETIRADLDAAWGLPNDKGTTTCISPATTAPKDSQGRVLLAVHEDFATWEPAATLLPQLLASGAVEEISEAAYRASLPQMPSPDRLDDDGSDDE
jgi:hypothetical protein